MSLLRLKICQEALEGQEAVSALLSAGPGVQHYKKAFYLEP